MKEGPSSKNSAALKQTSSSAPKLLKTETRLDPAANSESYERSDKVFVVEQDLKIDEKSGEQQRPREIVQQVIEQQVIEQPEVEQPRTWATAKLSNRNLSNSEFEILGIIKRFSSCSSSQLLKFRLLKFPVAQVPVAQVLVAQVP